MIQTKTKRKPSWRYLAWLAVALAILLPLKVHHDSRHVVILGTIILLLALVIIVKARPYHVAPFVWFTTKRRGHSVPDSEHKDRYVAIDCEMVGVGPSGKRSALARVSIVDWDLKVVFDTYVQVMDRVTDYRTHVSGIRPKHLKGPNAMNFRKCREHVAEIVRDKIIVGHGLENDFEALRLIHPEELIRDTSAYQQLQRFDSGKWKARKLRDLVQTYLGTQDFQNGEHDSIHDARAVMQLYHLFHRKWEQSIPKRTIN